MAAKALPKTKAAVTKKIGRDLMSGRLQSTCFLVKYRVSQHFLVLHNAKFGLSAKQSNAKMRNTQVDWMEKMLNTFFTVDFRPPSTPWPHVIGNNFLYLTPQPKLGKAGATRIRV